LQDQLKVGERRCADLFAFNRGELPLTLSDALCKIKKTTPIPGCGVWSCVAVGDKSIDSRLTGPSDQHCWTFSTAPDARPVVPDQTQTDTAQTEQTRDEDRRRQSRETNKDKHDTDSCRVNTKHNKERRS
jgi:hypothetical protein